MMENWLLLAIGYLAVGLTALSLLLRDMLMLRLLLVFAAVLGMLYHYLTPAGPNWLVILSLAVFTCINMIRIANLLAERRTVKFTDEEAELHQTIFRNFTPMEFMKIMRVARWSDAPAGTELARQNSMLDDLKLVYNGELAIERDGRQVGTLRDGALVGEMSYIRGGPATATVRALTPTRYVSWPKDELWRLLQRNPSMQVAMESVFSQELVRKLGAASGSADGG